MSGLQIFNAHPALYLGQASSFEHPIVSIGTAEKDGHEISVTNILGRRLRFLLLSYCGHQKFELRKVTSLRDPSPSAAWPPIPALF